MTPRAPPSAIRRLSAHSSARPPHEWWPVRRDWSTSSSDGAPTDLLRDHGADRTAALRPPRGRDPRFVAPKEDGHGPLVGQSDRGPDPGTPTRTRARGVRGRPRRAALDPTAPEFGRR